MSRNVALKCNATNRQGRPCGNLAMLGSSKCHLHGGKSLRGVQSPTFRHGRYSMALPEALARRYQTALADPDLLSLRDEIALLDARQQELLAQATNDETWEEISAITEQRRKLAESEFRRLAALQQMITTEQAMALIGRLVAIVRQYVTDPLVLAQIAADLRCVVNVPPHE